MVGAVPEQEWRAQNYMACVAYHNLRIGTSCQEEGEQDLRNERIGKDRFLNARPLIAQRYPVLSGQPLDISPVPGYDRPMPTKLTQTLRLAIACAATLIVLAACTLSLIHISEPTRPY